MSRVRIQDVGFVWPTHPTDHDSLDASVASINASVTSINNSISSINGSITTINSSINTINSQIAALPQGPVAAPVLFSSNFTFGPAEGMFATQITFAAIPGSRYRVSFFAFSSFSATANSVQTFRFRWVAGNGPAATTDTLLRANRHSGGFTTNNNPSVWLVGSWIPIASGSGAGNITVGVSGSTNAAAAATLDTSAGGLPAEFLVENIGAV